MPITPDLPFPKSAGDAIRSKDWNDLVTEIQRLDNAKVNRVGDAITGSLTVAGALGVGTTSPSSKLHVVDTNTPASLRIQSTQAFGTARLEFWSDPLGSGTEWRPGLIQSIDAGGFTGGLAFLTNGTGAANRTGLVEAMRLVNGNVGIGVPAPGLKVDIGDRIRLRDGASGTAGLWLFHATPNSDRAFIGMASDDLVGFWGNGGAGWGLRMNVVNGDIALLGKHAFRATDPWLRLNQDGAFTAGTHTPGLFAPGSLNVGGVGGWGNPGGGNIAYAGTLSKLDVADNFSGIVRCADFYIGHSSRRGSPGRAIVDLGTILTLNHDTDWSGGIRYYGSFGKASSRVLKENIQDLGSATAEAIFQKLNPVTYHHKSDPEKLLQIGFIAEDSPLEVTDKNKASVTIDHIIPVLVKVAQRQQLMLNALTNKDASPLPGADRSGMDFAEYFESADKKEIKPGYSVIFENGKVRPAKKGEIPIGIISRTPGVVGADPIEWPGKYLRNDFGEILMEEYDEEALIQKTQKVTRHRQKQEKKTITEEVFNIKTVEHQGKLIAKRVTEEITKEVLAPVFDEVDIYDDAGEKVIGKEKVPVMEAYETEEPIYDDKGNPVMIGSGKFEKTMRPKLNPVFNAEKEYVQRNNRPEWNCVGLLGQIPLRKGQPVAPTWVKIEDISDEVELWLVK